MSRLLSIFFFLLGQYVAAQNLSDTVLVIDPGHGDRASASIAADPGAGADGAWECVFAWDTAMRLKVEAEALGASVFLTTKDPNLDYEPKSWSATDFPQPGSIEFPYKTLVENPRPDSDWQVLSSRVATANRVYQEHKDEKDIIFLSLHFDSADPDLAGISFYYPTWSVNPPFKEALESSIRQSGRARKSVSRGHEVSLSKAYRYAVLSQSINPDSYLLELGNIRNESDLWRMKSVAARQAYANLICEALMARERKAQSKGRSAWLWMLGGLLVIGILAVTRQLGTERPWWCGRVS